MSGPSARVAILDRNSDRFFEIWFGAAKANAVLVPVNARLAAPEIAFVLQDALVEVLFIGASFLETLGKIRNQLTSVRDVIVINDSYAAWRMRRPAAIPARGAGHDDMCVQLHQRNHRASQGRRTHQRQFHDRDAQYPRRVGGHGRPATFCCWQCHCFTLPVAGSACWGCWWA